jgi:hypothetical protein
LGAGAALPFGGSSSPNKVDMDDDMELMPPLRKLEPNMPVDLVSGSLGSCRNRDSRRLREEGLRPGAGLPAGPWPNASTVRLLLRPGGPLEPPTPTCPGRC